jgi:hypothetical protein
MIIAAQLPGCLPCGFDLDSMLTVEQFAVWQGRSVSSARKSVAARMPGVVRESRECVRIHPRTYLEARLKRKVSA